ncbi:hypothetical protein [Micromonospora chersina]|uniref:hypothetical protein n=1 Tax=Micromonospora chersina TaxID=47854 RepID=UPI0033E7D540
MRPHRLLVAAAALSALAHLVGRWYDQPLLPAYLVLVALALVALVRSGPSPWAWAWRRWPRSACCRRPGRRAAPRVRG